MTAERTAFAAEARRIVRSAGTGTLATLIGSGRAPYASLALTACD